MFYEVILKLRYNSIEKYYYLVCNDFFFFCIIRSCWEWESKMRSIIALIIFVLGCYYFEPYMFPAAALLILLKYYLVCKETN